MSAIPSAQQNDQETYSHAYRLWATANPLTWVRWREPNTLQDHDLVPGSIVGINYLVNGQFKERRFLILGIRMSAKDGPVLLVEGQQLIRRENMMAAPAHNNTSFAVIFSIGDNELVRFGRPSVFNIDNLARLISPVTMFDCQTLSLPRVDTPQPFIRSSIAFKYDTHPYGGLSMLMPMLLLPMCVTKCKLTRTVYSPDSQCTRWCAQCRTWVHQGCMDRAPPVPVSQRIAPFFSAPGQENAVWDALLVAPIVRIPRGGAFPPFSIELLIRDVRASGGRPANIEHWFAAYTHRSFAGLLLGNWTYYTCPGCEGRI